MSNKSRNFPRLVSVGAAWMRVGESRRKMVREYRGSEGGVEREC